jgi:hypothetical protein
MPRVCQFYGIVIAMYHDDHEPAHFHVSYSGYRAVVGIDPIRILRGDLPRRAQSLVFEWAAIHQAELAENWQRARAHTPLLRIPPLD